MENYYLFKNQYSNIIPSEVTLKNLLDICCNTMFPLQYNVDLIIDSKNNQIFNSLKNCKLFLIDSDVKEICQIEINQMYINNQFNIKIPINVFPIFKFEKDIDFDKDIFVIDDSSFNPKIFINKKALNITFRYSFIDKKNSDYIFIKEIYYFICDNDNNRIYFNVLHTNFANNIRLYNKKVNEDVEKNKKIIQDCIKNVSNLEYSKLLSSSDEMSYKIQTLYNNKFTINLYLKNLEKNWIEPKSYYENKKYFKKILDKNCCSFIFDNFNSTS